ncbi:heavy-metal-associated domain-containing protein [Prescottella equi]|uniref:heavy-metal-associated domain-containing protein n=1 Tax=Rhodococcus hoagii TaxID=43767 RepID=UPI00085293B5|nr:heavy-metal-associated domain-containing protein [Prescottella equi]GBF16092.1 copper chaperone CopZ [Rhodococcus sp. Br-6]NKR45405.1 cation-transporting ATPase [Prescottella equi]NKS35413.1 cation-transporting ATPase [Prescottella equi]NKT15855.1 cation-transporting ATPase [Prescottella equi]NKW47866.1 cation-transporting ATPase [Prescottella equi]
MEHTYLVKGMTCQHCAAAVTEEISELSGVTSVDVDVDSGRVVVESESPLDTIAVAAAVTEAGYELVL